MLKLEMEKKNTKRKKKKKNISHKEKKRNQILNIGLIFMADIKKIFGRNTKQKPLLKIMQKLNDLLFPLVRYQFLVSVFHI